MFKCDYCNTEFKTKNGLVTHEKTAKYCLNSKGGDVQHPICKYCEKSFTRTSSLSDHYQTCIHKREHDVKTQYEHLLNESTMRIHELETQVAKCEQRIQHLEHQNISQEMTFQQRYYEALLQEKDKIMLEREARLERSERELEKRMDDITDIARQTKTKTTHTNTNIMINSATLDLQDTSHIREILERHLDINVLALGQKGVARMLKDTLLTDEQGQKRYRCTDANRGNFEYNDPSGHVERDPKAAKLRDALVKSDIRDLAYDRGDKFWKNEDGSTDMRKFDAISDKVQEVAGIQQDDTKFRTELSVLMS